jgi:hypothetical protein
LVVRQKLGTAVTIALVSSGLAVAGSCARGNADAKKRITPEYDKQTGKLRLLKYDSKGTGKIDTWSYMDGTRVVRIEIDQDGDGKIDRWEYYDANQKLEKVGFSRAKDGKEDAWSYAGPDGSVVRIDVSTRRDGRVTRVEHYDHDKLVSAEEDTDGDGRMDRWETYEGDRLASVAFDTSHRGTPDRRLVYGANSGVIVEVDPTGDGHFIPENQQSADRSPRSAGRGQQAAPRKPE